MQKSSTRKKNENIDLFVGLDVFTKNRLMSPPPTKGAPQKSATTARSVVIWLRSTKVMRKLQSTGRTLHVVYEAGPCGYAIYRHLSAKQIDCTVIGDLSRAREDAKRCCRGRNGQATSGMNPEAGIAGRCAKAPRVSHGSARSATYGTGRIFVSVMSHDFSSRDARA